MSRPRRRFTADQKAQIVRRHLAGKDTVRLRDLYFRAGVLEYWLVDARRIPLRFDILRRAGDAFVETAPVDGWVRSELFQRSFRLLSGPDSLGRPKFTLEVRRDLAA